MKRKRSGMVSTSRPSPALRGGDQVLAIFRCCGLPSPAPGARKETMLPVAVNGRFLTCQLQLAVREPSQSQPRLDEIEKLHKLSSLAARQAPCGLHRDGHFGHAFNA